MIETMFYIDDYRLTVRGHAGSGPAGQDPVCAGASTLAYTLANAVQELDDLGLVTDTVVVLDAAGTEIACKPADEYRNTVNLVWNALCSGFVILADMHPENIFFKIVRRGDREMDN